MTKPGKTSYHHGDLRAALLTAGEEVLSETGIEAFSLRAVAKRAGVSHAAPAHHFGDARGLLSALAAEGFRRFVETQTRREAAAGADPRDRLVASGLGYVDFAMAHPALFRLMFASDRPDFGDGDLATAASAAYEHLVENNRAIAEAEGRTHAQADVVATWAIAHGLADLLASGRLHRTLAMPPDERDAFLAGVIRRTLPA